MGDAHLYATDEHCRVADGHIESSGESHCGRVARNECELYAGDCVNADGVGEVEFVEVRSDA